MANNNYEKGVRRERYLVRKFREQGLFAVRFASSKGVVEDSYGDMVGDLLVIDTKTRIIRIVECKTGKLLGPKRKSSILQALKRLEGQYLLVGEVNEASC